MPKKIACSSLVLLLATTLAAAPAEAKPCRARCRRAVALCVAKHCSQFSGLLKVGCRRGLRITLVSACKHFPTSNICETVQAESCANN